jgi:hypothetical protein
MKAEYGYSCSIRGNELSLDWNQTIPSRVGNGYVLIARLRRAGFNGFNIMNAGHNLCLVSETSGSSEMPLKTEIVRGCVPAVAAMMMVEKKNDWWGDGYDFAVREKTNFEMIASAHIMCGSVSESLQIGECDVVVRKSLINGFSGVCLRVNGYSPNGFDGSNILDGHEIALLPDNQARIRDEVRTEMLRKWRAAIDGGGDAVVISAKGMAKTKVPAGTLIDYWERLILPDGRVFEKQYSGQGREFSAYYGELSSKKNLDELDIFKYRLIEADSPMGDASRIFGCRHGEAQTI